jgi:uncharacterized membrane protein (UPF0127 family)
MKLINSSKNNLVLAEQVVEAKSFWKRSRGLLGETHWPHSKVLWIHNCNSIHTWFMRFPIDVLFVNTDLEVCDILKNIPAWRVTLPRWKARHVFEFAAGALASIDIQKGDQLYVGD